MPFDTPLLGRVGLVRAAVLALLPCLVVTGCAPLTLVIGITPGDQKLTETVVADDGRWNSPKVALIDVSGMLINADRPGLLGKGEHPVSRFTEALDKARNDRKVRAILLRINSPGGTVTASEVMYRELQRFRADTGKPVVVVMMDVAASGAYYLSCAADHVVAHPSTVTGSVGVILQTVSLQPALGRWGITAETIKSGNNKDAGSPLAAMTPGQRETLAALVDDFYDRFVEVVQEARPQMVQEHAGDALDGRVVSGEQALAWGMVDQLGDLHDAFDRARQHAGLKYADLVLYHRPLDPPGSPYALAPVSHPAADTHHRLQIEWASPGSVSSGSGFYYLWQP
jgi:protease-4